MRPTSNEWTLAAALTKLTNRVRHWTGPGFLARERHLFNQIIGADRCGAPAPPRRERGTRDAERL